MLKIIRENSTKEIEDYKIGQESVRYRCDACGNRRMIKIAHIEDGHILCERCKRNEGCFEL